jgi:hypothetical protein
VPEHLRLQRLLDTPAGRVPDEVAATVRAFCERVDVIASGFVGLVEVTEKGRPPFERLSAAFEVQEAATRRELRQELRLVVERFYDSMPADVAAGGCNLLDEGGLGVWRERALQVFPRESATRQ